MFHVCAIDIAASRANLRYKILKYILLLLSVFSSRSFSEVTVVKVVFPRAVFLLLVADLVRSSFVFLGPASALIGKKRAGQLRILGLFFPAVPFPPSSRWVVYGSALRFIELLGFFSDLLIKAIGVAGVLGSGVVLCFG
ncbi:hypothetical protein ACOSQ2_022494 [Xanthoceras sorbifolium]